MLFRRRHLQRNLIGWDSKQSVIHTIDHHGNRVTQLVIHGPEPGDYMEEIFDIKEFEITWHQIPTVFTEKDTSEVIETSFFISVISRDRHDVKCYRFEEVSGFSFKLVNPLK